MRIVMVSDLETTGGAAVAASRLATALVEAGHDVERLVHRPDEGDWAWRTRTVANRLLDSRGYRAAVRLLPRTAWDVRARAFRSRFRRLVREIRPDVVNIHNIHFARWDASIVDEIARQAPVVWTLHDMWSFTGRCAYSYDCRQFATTGCDASCPTTGEYPRLPLVMIRESWEQKQRVLGTSDRRIVAVTPSEWLAREARSGAWPDGSVSVIPYGLPLQEFRPTDRRKARESLGLSQDAPTLLVAAQYFMDRRKGGAILLEALRHVRSRPVQILTLGNGELPELPSGIHVHPLGYVRDQDAMVSAFCAADALVHAAPVDNLPNVIMEAMACGTPTVGFPIGGVPDMVRPGMTGWLAPEVSAVALAETVDHALTDIIAGNSLRESCRTVAEAEYDVQLQAARYERLFAEVCERTAGSRIG